MDNFRNMDIKVTVETVDSRIASLKTEDGQFLTWPINKLPKDTKPGRVFVFSITDSGVKSDPEQIAKDLLNEILNIE